MEENEKAEYLANEEAQLADWADNQNKEKPLSLSDKFITIQMDEVGVNIQYEMEEKEVIDNERYEKDRYNYFSQFSTDFIKKYKNQYFK